MANLTRRQQGRDEPALMTRLDPFQTIRDLFRWDPFRSDPFADMDISPRIGVGMFMPDVEIKETPEALVMKADLPGMKEDEVDISVVGNRMTISGRREEEDRREDAQYFAYERRYGTFSRTFVLPETYDPDQVKAELKDGVLTVEIPKRPGAQARHIPLGSQSRGKEAAGSLTSGAGAGEGTGTGGGSAGSSAGTGSSTGRGSTQGERTESGKSKAA